MAFLPPASVFRPSVRLRVRNPPPCLFSFRKFCSFCHEPRLQNSTLLTTPLPARTRVRSRREAIRMVKTASTMLPLGTVAPDFTLPEPKTGKMVSLKDVKGEKGLCIVFMCNHCPFVKHVSAELKRLGTDFPAMGIGFVGISSNDVDNYPDDHPDRMAEAARSSFSTFPYLYDRSQEVAKSYKAACTPDFYIFDAELRLQYRGQLDGSRPGNQKPVTGSTLREAAAAIVDGQEVKDQFQSMGCNIKWLAGNEPSYFG